MILTGSLFFILSFDGVFRLLSLSINLSKISIIHLIIPAITIFIYYILELYDLSLPRNLEMIFFYVFIANCIASLFYSALSYFIISLRPGKTNLLFFMSSAIVITFLWRLYFKNIIFIKRKNILFVGTERIFDDIRDVIEKVYDQYYTVVDQWSDTPNGMTAGNLSQYMENANIDMVVFSLRSKLVLSLAEELISCNFSGKSVIDAYSFYQRLTYKCPLNFLDDFTMLVNINREVILPTITSNVKRVIDLLCVFLALPFAIPVLIVAAIAIKSTSEGPIFFIQERLAQNEKQFRLYKLRTMIRDAEKQTGPQWSTDSDPRITPVGRILRKLRLDELPQLFNVMKGEMSIVGPRPIRRHFADVLATEIPFYRLRFLVKPGLTGWAQVHYDYAGSNQGQLEKQQYDLFYLIHQSIPLDLYVIFKTIRVMVWGKGT